VREEWLIPTLEALTLVEQFDLASRWHREWIDESRKRGNAFLLSGGSEGIVADGSDPASPASSFIK
jgi:hypothetical protein